MKSSTRSRDGMDAMLDTTKHHGNGDRPRNGNSGRHGIAVAGIGLTVLLVCLTGGCAGMQPTELGVVEGRLLPCPERPNCVSSDSDRPNTRIEAFRIASSPEDAWQALTDLARSWPRSNIVDISSTYLHMEVRSRLFGFVDDVEFHLRAASERIAVRSASRTGYSDLGVNRRRIERMRDRLVAGGHVE